MFRLHSVAGILAILLLLAGCGRNSAICDDQDVLGTLKLLVLQKQTGDSATENAAALLQISGAREISSTGSIEHCGATFSVSNKALSAVKLLGPEGGDLARLAHNAGLSDSDIQAGINSGDLDYEVEASQGAPQQYSVTLKNFSVGRARVFAIYLKALTLASTAKTMQPPASFVWSARSDGDPKLYRVGDLNLTLSSKADAGRDGPAPFLRINGGDVAPIEATGATQDNDTSATLLVGNIDPAVNSNQVVFQSFTGGAHCCTEILIFDRQGGKWKELNFGMWDGEPLGSLPKDVDGDHIPDIVFPDQAFFYAFASYADSYAPPRVYNLVNSQIKDVSQNPRYAPIFLDFMTEAAAACMLHENGGCAAFVASASRVNAQNWAWGVMLSNYDASDTWELPKSCDVPIPREGCPKGHEVSPTDFPSALSAFLIAGGYLREQPNVSLADHVPPSFDCEKVHSQVLRLVCATPKLAAMDRELAAAFFAAISNSSAPDQIREEERVWIAQRNSSPGDPESLGTLYQDRIATLINLAREEAAARAAQNR